MRLSRYEVQAIVASFHEVLARLKKTIGDRKIDVVFDMDPARLVEQEARRRAIPL
jgi:hypothetical protein